MTEGLKEEDLNLGNEEVEEPQPPVVSKTMPAQTSQRQPMPPSLVSLQQKPTPAVTTEEGGGPARSSGSFSVSYYFSSESVWGWSGGQDLRREEGARKRGDPRRRSLLEMARE